MAMALFSKEYFKQQFFGDLVSLSADIVPNVRLKLCTMMPRYVYRVEEYPKAYTVKSRAEAHVTIKKIRSFAFTLSNANMSTLFLGTQLFCL